jgi:hypothetical protein
MISETELADQLYYNYENFVEATLLNRRFKHSEILPLINNLKNKDIFTVTKAGNSTEGRNIYLISAGTGKTKVFLWSQMHGNESTATMAIFDIFNFFSSGNNFEKVKTELLKKLTIYFMPMVNPDGAEYFQRRNSLGIDINRDASKLESKEGKLLQKIFTKISPHFGFNLHDQSTAYSAGKSFKPATISFLAPPANESRKMTPGGKKAALLIAKLYKEISTFIPGHIAKYSDEFEPRAFGDNFQKAGTSTILIESGGWKHDPEKMFVRKINFITILTALYSIASKCWKNEKIETYEKIPFNEEILKDIIIRNLSLVKSGKRVLVDIGLKLEEINIKNSRSFYIKSEIEDIGDLSVFYGYEDHDFKGMTVEYGKTFPKKFNSLEEIKKIDFFSLYKNGYTNVVVKKNVDLEFSELPINIIKSGEKITNKNWLEKPANLVFRKNGSTKYIMVNGFLVNVNSQTGQIMNGLVYC